MPQYELTEFELGWVVGFLEGEGCFFTHTTRRSRGRLTKPTPRVQVGSTDLDALERLHQLLGGIGHIQRDKGRVREAAEAEGRWRPSWRWLVSDHRACDLMRLVMPHMHKRRTAKIKEVLDACC